MKYFLFLFTFLAFVFLIRPFFHAGYPFTHDGENHLARIENYVSAIHQGQIPPRWAPTFAGGYGYPVFNYNYPLPNILSAPFLGVGVSAELTFKIVQVLALLFGSYAVFLFLKRHVKTEAAFVGVIAYLTAPVIFNDLFVRGVVGEVLAYTLFPHVLLSAARFVHDVRPRTALYFFISVAAFSLSHNFFVLILLPVATVYVLKELWKRDLKKTVLPVLFTFTVAVLTSMFFWLPALMEKSLVVLDTEAFLPDLFRHFPTLDQLLTSPYSFGYSLISPLDTMSYGLGFVFIFAALLVIPVLIVRKTKRFVLLATLAVFLFTVFLMLSVSSPIWQAVSLIRYAQFPWRLLLASTLIGVFLVAQLYEILPRSFRWLLVLILVVSTIGMGSKRVATYIHHDDLYYKTFTQTSTAHDENHPLTFTRPAGDLSTLTPVFEKDGTAEIHIWNGSHHDYTTHAKVDQFITEPTAYFPGWVVRIDDVFVPISYDQAEGLIHFAIPKGDHHVVTLFTQNTPARLIGNTTTILSYVAFGIFFLVLSRTSSTVQTTETPILHEKGKSNEKRAKKRAR